MTMSRRRFNATLTGATCAALTPFDAAVRTPLAEGSMAPDEICDWVLSD